MQQRRDCHVAALLEITAGWDDTSTGSGRTGGLALTLDPHNGRRVLRQAQDEREGWPSPSTPPQREKGPSTGSGRTGGLALTLDPHNGRRVLRQAQDEREGWPSPSTPPQREKGPSTGSGRTGGLALTLDPHNGRRVLRQAQDEREGWPSPSTPTTGEGSFDRLRTNGRVGPHPRPPQREKGPSTGSGRTETAGSRLLYRDSQVELAS